MWFVGKPVLDLCGHLGTGAGRSVVDELIVSVCLTNKAQINTSARIYTYTTLSHKLKADNPSVCEFYARIKRENAIISFLKAKLYTPEESREYDATQNEILHIQKQHFRV